MNKLNDKQIEAINSPDGVTIVIAGAGSGKTTVLTKRIVKLLKDGVKDDRILAITFTNKAANEMKERTNQEIFNHCFISTFHSLCFHILRNHIHLLNYKNDFTVIDDSDINSIIKQIIKDNNLIIDFKKDIGKNLFLNYYVKKRYFDLDIIETHHYKQEIEKIYQEFYKILRRDNLLTFDDLLYLTKELFLKKPQVLAYYQEKYLHILVDEYQDTNDVQNELVMMLSKKHQNIFIVGDEDQSIYGFRGANINNLKNFRKVFKNARIIKLEQNYRSTNAILETANSVIKNNKDRVVKKLWTANRDNNKVSFRQYYDNSSELDAITNKIEELNRQGVAYKNIAILYRSGFVSRFIEDRLRIRMIPYITYGGFDFFKRIHIKYTLAYLNAIMSYNDRFKVMNIINYPSRKIGPKTIKQIEMVLDDTEDKTIEDIFLNASDYFPSSLAKKLNDFMKMLISINVKLATLDNITDIIDIVLKDTGLEKEFRSLDKASERLDDVYTLKDMIKEWDTEDLNNYDVMKLVLEETSAIYSYENTDVSSDKVVLSTVHTAKGLEFDYVFLPFFDEGIFPSRQALFDEGAIDKKSIEEERRLCYVALTRAKKGLFISSAKSRFIFGTVTSARPSRFLMEMDDNYLDKETTEKKLPTYLSREYEKNYKVKSKSQNEKLTSGDKVEHVKFGKGVVVSVKDGIATIAFSSEYGIKKIMANHPTLTKL